MEKIIEINGLKTDYSCDDKGRVFSFKNNRRIELKYNTHKDGYQMCYLYVKGIKHSILRHRIIALCFVSNLENKKQVNHKDGIKSNCKPNNLEWSTQSENIRHAYANKLMAKSYKNIKSSKLNDIQISEIKKMIVQNIKQRNIALKYNVTEQCISNIKRGVSYKSHLMDESEPFIPVTDEFNPYK